MTELEHAAAALLEKLDELFWKNRPYVVPTQDGLGTCPAYMAESKRLRDLLPQPSDDLPQPQR